MLHKDYDRKGSVGKKKISGRESQWTWRQDEYSRLQIWSSGLTHVEKAQNEVNGFDVDSSLHEGNKLGHDPRTCTATIPETFEVYIQVLIFVTIPLLSR
jgi:hypothetical protein